MFPVRRMKLISFGYIDKNSLPFDYFEEKRTHHIHFTEYDVSDLTSHEYNRTVCSIIINLSKSV